MKVVLGMPFLIRSNADVQFAEKELTWKIYTTEEALPTIRQFELIDQKEFAKAVLDENIKTFVMCVSSLRLRMTIHLAKRTQMALFLAIKISIPAKYLDFANVFSKKLANILQE